MKATLHRDQNWVEVYSHNWHEELSDPISAVANAALSLFKLIHHLPNEMHVTADAHQALRLNIKVIDRIRYTRSLDHITNDQLMAEVFDVDKYIVEGR